MPRLLAAALLFAALPAAASAVAPTTAADSRLEAAFGNTIVSTYPDGRVAKLWLERDGGYRGQGRKGGLSSGRWTVKGDKICLKQTRPMPMPMTYCTPLVDGKVGARWSGKAVTGEPVRLELVSGR